MNKMELREKMGKLLDELPRRGRALTLYELITLTDQFYNRKRVRDWESPGFTGKKHSAYSKRLISEGQKLVHARRRGTEGITW